MAKQIGWAGTPDEVVKYLSDLIARAQAGEEIRAAFRLYNKDGTYEDIVFAPTEEEKDQLLADLRQQIGQGH